MGSLLSKVFEDLQQLFAGKSHVRMLMLGLDAAGKTTIMYRFKIGEVVHTIPTIGFNCEEIEYGNLRFVTWDIGGQDRIRPLWRHYFHGTQALLYVVDSSDVSRFEESNEELNKMLMEDDLKGIPLLVFANKQDLPNAQKAERIVGALGLNEINDRKWYVQTACATTGAGLYEGLDWLAKTMRNHKKQ